MRPSVGILSLLGLMTLGGAVQAQMFGERQLGVLLRQQDPPGTMSNRSAPAINNPGGTINGSERFIRGRRQATDFVGTDARDRRGFIGATQSRNRRTPPAAATLQPRPEPNVNQAAQAETATGNALYQPRLVLAPELAIDRPSATQAAIERRLRSTQALQPLGSMEVAVVGRTAILRGQVASARDRELAESLVQFEPGISDVQNDLRVNRPTVPPAPAVAPEPLEPTRPPVLPPQRTPREF